MFNEYIRLVFKPLAFNKFNLRVRNVHLHKKLKFYLSQFLIDFLGSERATNAKVKEINLSENMSKLQSLERVQWNVKW